MTFIAQETGTDTGSPFELYEFVYGSSSWYYTSADEDYIDGDITYVSTVMNRSSIIMSSAFGKNSVNIDVPPNLDFLDLFRITTPSSVVSVTVKKVHQYDNINQIVVMWKGRVLNVDWATTNATLICESIRSSVRRYGLRRQFQTSCPHVLYGDQCLVDKVDYKETGTVAAIDGLTITISGFDIPDEETHFSGGYIEYIDTILNATVRRMITAENATNNSITVVAPTLNLTVGMSVDLYPGCDHTLGTCDTKFDNSINYGGLPYTPTISPFGGGLIY